MPNGPYRRSAPLPSRLEDVTADWLTAILGNRYPGLVVERMDTVEVRNSHTTKLRVAVALNAVGRGAGLPDRLCLKANWSGGFDSADICRLEAQFYHSFGQSAGLPIARCFHADWDDDGSGQGVVVLEDLVALGGTFGHSRDLIGIDGVERGLEDMAVLHGRFWNDPALQAADWLPLSMRTPVDTDQLRLMWTLVSENLARDVYLERLPRWITEDHDRFQRVYGLLNDYAVAQPGPLCIVHGDSHLGNTYLKPDGHRIWLDWQLVRRGQPWRDVAYFMIGALTIAERRTAERDLLARYRDALLRTGARNVPDAETAWQQYRRWPMYGLQAWLGIKDWWGQDGLPAIERFSAASEDLETLRLLEAG